MTENAKSNGATFVLVHGAWHGGWCWRRVADLLTARGHKVFTPTLTGLGERAHLLSADIGLTTHVTDVVNVFRFERLSDVVLVGHSYGGAVISGAVAAVESQVSSIVFLDAFLPADGESSADAWPPETRAQREAEAAKSGGVSLPAPPAAFFKVNAADQPWVDSLLVPQPFKTFTDKSRHNGARDRIGKKTYVFSPRYNAPYFRANYERLRNDPSWRVSELDCGHDMMVDLPGPTADLVEAAR